MKRCPLPSSGQVSVSRESANGGQLQVVFPLPISNTHSFSINIYLLSLHLHVPPISLTRLPLKQHIESAESSLLRFLATPDLDGLQHQKKSNLSCFKSTSCQISRKKSVGDSQPALPQAGSHRLRPLSRPLHLISYTAVDFSNSISNSRLHSFSCTPPDLRTEVGACTPTEVHTSDLNSEL